MYSVTRILLPILQEENDDTVKGEMIYWGL